MGDVGARGGPTEHHVYDFYREIPSDDVPTKWKNFYFYTCRVLGAFSYFSPIDAMSFLCLCARKRLVVIV